MTALSINRVAADVSRRTSPLPESQRGLTSAATVHGHKALRFGGKAAFHEPVHETGPLTLSLSPSEGERVAQPGEGDSMGFMVPARAPVADGSFL